jgi:hypothetical protein
MDAETSKHRDEAKDAPADLEAFRDRGYNKSYGQTFGPGAYTGRPGRGRYSSRPGKSPEAMKTYDSDIERFRERAY